MPTPEPSRSGRFRASVDHFFKRLGGQDPVGIAIELLETGGSNLGDHGLVKWPKLPGQKL